MGAEAAVRAPTGAALGKMWGDRACPASCQVSRGACATAIEKAGAAAGSGSDTGAGGTATDAVGIGGVAVTTAGGPASGKSWLIGLASGCSTCHTGAAGGAATGAGAMPRIGKASAETGMGGPSEGVAVRASCTGTPLRATSSEMSAMPDHSGA